jgi:hypothetical protein
MELNELRVRINLALMEAKTELTALGKVKSEALLISDENTRKVPLTFSGIASKRKQQLMLKRAVQKDPKIEAVVLKLEAWVKAVDRDDTATLEKISHEGVETQKEKEEAIVINGSCKDHDINTIVTFKRDAEKKLTFAEPKETEASHASAFTEGMWSRSLQDVLDNYDVLKFNVKTW